MRPFDDPQKHRVVTDTAQKQAGSDHTTPAVLTWPIPNDGGQDAITLVQGVREHRNRAHREVHGYDERREEDRQATIVVDPHTSYWARRVSHVQAQTLGLESIMVWGVM